MTVSARPVPKVDPIELEIIQEAMISIVREMRVNLVATAYSSIIYEAYDFSCVLIDGDGPDRGAGRGQPVPHLPGALVGQADVRHVRGRHRAG